MSGIIAGKVSMGDIASGQLANKLQPQLGQKLLENAQDGNVEAVRKLLKIPGINVNQADRYGNTVLIWAALNGKVEVVKLIMDKLGLQGVEVTN